MTAPLSDRVLARLATSLDEPDLAGTRYRLVRAAGRGGMGTVWEARDALLERPVALKVVDAEGHGARVAERLLAEARTLAALEHPGIVPVHDAGTLADGRAYCAMKLVRGETLDAAAAGRPLPARLRLFLRVCEPVAFAHARGFVHRDLKPANVMVGPFGEVLVLDWGVAAATGAEPGVVAGTPGFMAPEQERGDPADARADVFALGRLLADLSGPEPPRPLASVLSRATAPASGDRYVSVEALARDVTRWLDGDRPEAHRETLVEKSARLYRRHRVAILLLATYLVVRAAVFLTARR